MRDAFPGINAVTLMEWEEPVDPQQARLLPVIRYAVERRLGSRAPDYWDHATMLEISVLARDRDAALDALADALAAVRERWEPETTSRNLKLISEVRKGRGESVEWISEIEAALAKAAAA